jgi:DNA-binding transcriptional regulator GbsR (MarR family)
MLALTVRTPVRMTQDFGKRVKKDVKKVNKAFERLQKESDDRRKDLSANVDELVKYMDKVARGDVDKLKSLLNYEADSEDTIDIADFVEVDDIVKFKD